MGKVGPDGKVRVRCQQCGKKLKMPANTSGKIYNCPICGSTVVAPLDESEVGGGGDAAHLSAQDVRRLGWTPTLSKREKYASMEKLANFLSREYAEMTQTCARMLSNENFTVDEASEKVIEMRKELAVKIRRYSLNLVREVEKELFDLQNHPLRKQQAYIEKAQMKERELRDLSIFLKMMFNLSVPTSEPGDKAAQ